MTRRYAILDVFTDRPLAGNPLAVVLDAEGLAESTMQALAAEFNLSETVFVLPAANPVHTAQIRIFTPAAELPFAGHPTVGSAVLLALERAGSGGGEMVLVMEERVGPVRCGVSVTGPRSGRAVFDVPRRPQAVPFAADRDAIARALGLMPTEIGFENHQPSAFGSGLDYAFVPIRDLDAIAKARVNVAAWDAAFPSPAGAAYLYCREAQGAGHHFHGRMFAPGLGITEDPATGSAVAAFAGVIHRFDGPAAGNHRYLIEQGYEMGRPSLITLEIDIEAGDVAASRIGGDAVVVARGTLDL